ncbi:recombinase family protein [Lachnoclostridium edouardi]|uniref:recombinase family protein n=1 Tax=Lachnoclostridium edouardi TaxID=1926283 RepID=UPI000C7A2174|nr:recombinase family protein [Lachnoclostridium edouardi]
MKEEYGYCRISTPKQNISRQERNILEVYPAAHIIKEVFTGTKTTGRKEWNKLYKLVKQEAAAGKEITIIFDSVSRMSRNADEGFQLYEELFNLGISLVFLKEPHINTDTYKNAINVDIQMTGTNADILLKAVKEYLMQLAKEQIRIAFEQAEKEVLDLHQRTSEGIKTAKLNGKQIGRIKGNKYTTKKETAAKEIILKNSKDFNGTNTDSEVIKIAGISRNSYYKYKAELKAAAGN